MKIYLVGNWKRKDFYIGEPQRTLELLIDNEKFEIGDFDLKRNSIPKDGKFLIFGSFYSLIIRYIKLRLFGKKCKDIAAFLFKDKYCLRDLFFTLRNTPISKIHMIYHPAIVEILIPKSLFDFTLKKMNMLGTASPDVSKRFNNQITCLAGKILEINELERLENKKDKIDDERLVYFGRDDFLRGVDIIYNLSKSREVHMYMPFEGYLSKFGDFRDCDYVDYGNKENIFIEVQSYQHSLFLFRSRWGGPDLPATLIESIMLGVKPVISGILNTEYFKESGYPLYLSKLNVNQIEKLLVKYSKSSEKNNLEKSFYKLRDLIKSNLCFDINIVKKEIVEKYESF